MTRNLKPLIAALKRLEKADAFLARASFSQGRMPLSASRSRRTTAAAKTATAAEYRIKVEAACRALAFEALGQCDKSDTEIVGWRSHDSQRLVPVIQKPADLSACTSNDPAARCDECRCWKEIREGCV